MDNTTKERLMSALADKGITPGCTFEHDVLVDKYKVIEEVLLREVFTETYRSNMDTRFLISHFNDVADQYELKDSLVFKNVINELSQLSMLIGSLKNGVKGEERVRQSLERLDHSKTRILRNICLETPVGNNEYDFIVISPKGLFIIEVKYSKSPTYIDELGNFKHTDGSGNHNYNIADSLERKEYILFNSLTAELQSTFTRDRIHSCLCVVGNTNVQNLCRGVQVGTAGTVFNMIAHFKTTDHRLFLSEIDELASYLQSINAKTAYPIDVDIERLCADFSEFIELIEEASDAEDVYEEIDSFEEQNIKSAGTKYKARVNSEIKEETTAKHFDKKSVGIGAAIGTAAGVAVIYLPKFIKYAIKYIK
jgi:hypothetical protein